MLLHSSTEGFPGGSVVKNPPASAGHAEDVGSIPGKGRSPGEGNGNPLQYSCLETQIHDDISKGKAQSRRRSCERRRGSPALNPQKKLSEAPKPRSSPTVLSPPTSCPSLPHVPRDRKSPWHHCCLQGLRSFPLRAAVWGWSQPVRQERLGALPWGLLLQGAPTDSPPTEATWRLDQSSWFSS